MNDFTTAEMLRTSIHELSLNAKIICSNMSIEDFLLQAVEPPPLQNIQQSVQLLQQINALDSDENITCLGMHLAKLSVDCQLAKAIMYAVFFGCIDPVVTIISVLSFKNPFVLPVSKSKEIASKIYKAKESFLNNSKSDHQMLLNLFYKWSEHHNKKKFCSENFISNGVMKRIREIQQSIFVNI